MSVFRALRREQTPAAPEREPTLAELARSLDQLTRMVAGLRQHMAMAFPLVGRPVEGPEGQRYYAPPSARPERRCSYVGQGQQPPPTPSPEEPSHAK